MIPRLFNNFLFKFYFNKAIRFVNLNKYKQAIKEYEKALCFKKDYYDLYWGLGKAYREVGELNKAKEILLKAIKFNPNGEKAHLNLGIVYHDLRLYNDTKCEYETAIKINPNNKENYLHLGIVLVELNEYTKSLEAYKKAIELDPEYKRAYCNIGLLFEIQNNFREAILWYEKVLLMRSKDIYSNNFDIYFHMGQSYNKLNEIELAVDSYTKCLQLTKDEKEINKIKTILRDLNKDGME